MVSSSVPVTASPVPAPLLSVPEAVEYLRLTGVGFLFFVDTGDRRGRLLHRRHDGGYGLVEPATEAVPG